MHLIFSKSQTQESFTNSSTSQFNDKNEHALFRELIQNAIDAAQPDYPAEVVISHHTVKIDEIPGLADMQEALEAANEFWNQDPQTHKIVPRIQQALESDKLNLLVISDNGVGLNKDRMNDILHDGASRKDPNSAGSYGNGHISTFKFSDLLYVLYVGVSDDGILISGHTILASHKDKDGLRGKDGFLAKQILDDRDDGYEFYEIEAFQSEFLLQTVNKIKQKNDTGTSVIITAFDTSNPNLDQELAEKIERISSLHFFPSIADGKLSITYVDFDSVKTLIEFDNLGLVLSKFSQEERSRELQGGPTGKRIYEAFLTYQPENKSSLETSIGDVEFFLRTSDVFKQNINIFRKGMWITQKVQGLEERYFSDYEPFDLVINIERESNPKLHDLVKSCEGSLHMHLKRRQGHEDEWERLSGFWKEFREALKDLLTEQSFEEVTPTDFASIDIDKKKHPDNKTNAPVITWIRERGASPPTPPPVPISPDNQENYFQILGDIPEVEGMARRSASNEIFAILHPKHTIKFPELRIAEMPGQDLTCEVRGDNRLNLHYCEIDELFINEENIEFKVNEKGIRKKPNSDGEPKGVFAVRLNEFKKNNPIKLRVKFLPNLGDERSFVQIDLVDRTREMGASNG